MCHLRRDPISSGDPCSLRNSMRTPRAFSVNGCASHSRRPSWLTRLRLSFERKARTFRPRGGIGEPFGRGPDQGRLPDIHGTFRRTEVGQRSSNRCPASLAMSRDGPSPPVQIGAVVLRGIQRSPGQPYGILFEAQFRLAATRPGLWPGYNLGLDATWVRMLLRDLDENRVTVALLEERIGLLPTTLNSAALARPASRDVAGMRHSEDGGLRRAGRRLSVQFVPPARMYRRMEPRAWCSILCAHRWTTSKSHSFSPYSGGCCGSTMASVNRVSASTSLCSAGM